MPKEWEDQAKAVAKSYVKRGVDPKKAKQIGYATATKEFEKRHGGQHPRPKKKGKK